MLKFRPAGGVESSKYLFKDWLCKKKIMNVYKMLPIKMDDEKIEAKI